MRRTLAIARLTMKGAFRVKAFIMLLGFLLVTVVVLPLTVKGDGTVRGHVQVLLSYSLGISCAILSLATMWLSCDTLCRDVDDYHIQLVATKPIPRWQIWLGKWLGIMALNALLLGIVGLVVYGLLLWTTRPGQLTKLERQELVNEVLVARTQVTPNMPDVSAEVEKQYQERKTKGDIPGDLSVSEFREQLEHNLLTKRYTAPNMGTVRWVFKGITLDRKSSAPLYLRFKHFTSVRPPKEQVWGQWRIGEPGSPNLHVEQVAFRPDSFHEISAPASALSADGTLTVEYSNIDQFLTTVVFPLEDGMEVLYRVGSFGGNYLRSLLLLFIPLGLLAAIALCAGSFLTFPVAVFVCMSYLYLVLLSGPLEGVVQQSRIIQKHSHGETQQKYTKLADTMDSVVRYLIRGGLYLTSSVRSHNPVGDLVVGRVVGWAEVAKVCLSVLCLQGGLFALLGMGLLTRRELAALQR